jgi:NAD(P)-dependent dehydrogenase (short-subunit alcohol dehydrogenase family)
VSSSDRRQVLQDIAAQARRPVREEPLPLDVKSLFSVEGKVAVLADLCGSGSREIAELLAAAGAQVVVGATELDACAEHAEQLKRRGLSAYAIQADIENEADVTALFADVAAAAGRIDIAVNCAGVSTKIPLIETSMEIWDQLQSINLRSNFMCTREAVRQMLATRSQGRIVNVTSICGVHPVTHGNAAYAATRQGVTAISRTAALDYVQDGILVNTLLVGAVRDRVVVHPETIARQSNGASVSGPLNQPGRMPLGFGTMQDVAAAVLYLVSPAGRYITGQELVLDGGFLLT